MTKGLSAVSAAVRRFSGIFGARGASAVATAAAAVVAVRVGRRGRFTAVVPAMSEGQKRARDDLLCGFAAARANQD
jgi:hypothetical protein